MIDYFCVKDLFKNKKDFLLKTVDLMAILKLLFLWFIFIISLATLFTFNFSLLSPIYYLVLIAPILMIFLVLPFHLAQINNRIEIDWHKGEIRDLKRCTIFSKISDMVIFTNINRCRCRRCTCRWCYISFVSRCCLWTT